MEALGLAGTEDLADIGCGDARFLARLNDAGHTGRLVGVDTSPAMAAAANAISGVTAVTAEAERWFTDHPGEVWRDPKGYTHRDSNRAR
ncbi:methyltransferase [Nocardia cyriacigeorgica]|uniref:methyltransferase n=1 Tax=Nocardia cyriacigeorgica TaxID=135487 RepID=UPI0015B6557E